MLTDSQVLRGSSSLSKECLIELYGKLKFPVGSLVTTIIVMYLICYLLRLCDKASLLVLTGSPPSPLAPLPFSGEAVSARRATRGPRGWHPGTILL